ncbi:glutamate synthase subunit beta [Pontibacillus sp. HMF3514]|uniref:glutamate synthase subunit beta n=1 Tax=Pontibacillus sp. HMF3514 TaxID=2692425 RepID=UPI0013202054|nr:glutamate synthase subunit beta [Pontibacillus sp. HMF3514]QHE52746.1 glutamate synthase small subunit [Pontibacillus sp. HMF3514]
MGKATGFMEIAREEATKRNPGERIKDWNEYVAPFSDEELKRQGARCMDCGTPFCHTGMEIKGVATGCPINNLIPEWNDLVYRGRWKEALEKLQKTNNFPEFTGRVCPAPCEGGCTLAISDPAVAIKDIERTIIDKGFENGWITPRIPEDRTGKSIAVIGSGPAGLAAADQLNQAGHSVTVYERSNRAGGLLTYGIPNMKLEKEIVQRRIDLLEQEEIHFVTNTEVGKDITAEELQNQHDAVILCTGAQKQRDMNIPGRDSKGIHYAMDYLTASTQKLFNEDTQDQYINVEGKDVIVIGGGDTGADCVATALRQKCKSVVQFGKHPQKPLKRTEDNLWPEPPDVYTLDYAYKEAEGEFGKDPRRYSIQTKEFIKDENGDLKELHTIQLEKVKDENRGFVHREIPGTEQVWPAQHVFIAIGFEGPEQPVLKHFGVNTTERSCVDAKYGEYTTNVEGVFSAGDARRGQSLIVWAINEGREVAREVDEYLMGVSYLPS